MHDLFPSTLVCLIRRGHCRLLYTLFVTVGWSDTGFIAWRAFIFVAIQAHLSQLKYLILKKKKNSSTIKHEEWIDNDNCSGLILYTIIWGYQRKLEYIYRVPKQGCRVLLYGKKVKDSNVSIKGITYMYLFCFLFSSHTISYPRPLTSLSD